MAEEVNSKALAAGSTANRLGIPYAPTRAPRRILIPAPRAPATPPSPRRRIAGSTYRGIGLRSADWGSTRRAGQFGQMAGIMSSHLLLAQHLRLAQNDKRKSEHDGRGDHGSELGKYRPESARSELQCLAPCSPTKIVRVGLHVATSCWAHRPATPAARP